MREMIIADVIDVLAGSLAKRDVPAIVQGDKIFTWGDYDERKNQISNALIDLGVGRMDNVGLETRSCHEFTEALWGAVQSGFVCATINYRYVGNELKYIFNINDTKALIVDEDFIDVLPPILPETKIENIIVRRTGLNRELPDGWFEYEDLIKRYPKTPPKVPWERAHEDEPMVIINTSGTTGTPKAVIENSEVLTGILKELGTYAAPLLPGLVAVAEDLKIGSKFGIPFLDPLLASRALREIISHPATGEFLIKLTRTLVPLILGMGSKALRGPLSLFFYLLAGRLRMLDVAPYIQPTGFAFGNFITPMTKGTVYLPTSKSFSPKEAWELIEKWRPNSIVAAGNTQWGMMAEGAEPGEYDTSSVVICFSAGMPLGGKVRAKIGERFPNAVVIDQYGSSEAYMGSFSLYNKYTMAEEQRFKKPDFMAVIGEDGKPVPVGEVGELAQSGGTRALGYYKQPEITEKMHILVSGKDWQRLGDYAVEDEKGYITIIGRGAEVINSGGIKVWPGEVEDVLEKNPKVYEAAIVGIPDERWGEAVTAIVKLRKGEKATEKEIIDWCEGKIAGYKKPKYAMFDEVLKTEIGKKWHIKMRDKAIEKFGRKGL